MYEMGDCVYERKGALSWLEALWGSAKQAIFSCVCGRLCIGYETLKGLERGGSVYNGNLCDEWCAKTASVSVEGSV